MAENSEDEPAHNATWTMLDRFASVGVSHFDVTLIMRSGKKDSFRRGIPRRNESFLPLRMINVTSKWLTPTLAKRSSIVHVALWAGSSSLFSAMRLLIFCVAY